jgi:hypothetical protein
MTDDYTGEYLSNKRILSEEQREKKRKYNKELKKGKKYQEYLRSEKYRQYQREYQREYQKEYQRNLTEEQKEKRRKYQREYQSCDDRKDKKKKWDREYQKTDKWRKYNREYQAMRKATDPNFKLRHNIRTFIRNKYKSTKKSIEILGCDLETFRKWIEDQFEEGMTWENNGVGEGKWNYDHKIPLSWFDCSKEEELLKANNYTNIKPMWSLDNIKKSNKYAD